MEHTILSDIVCFFRIVNHLRDVLNYTSDMPESLLAIAALSNGVCCRGAVIIICSKMKYSS
jgi:hypothetical protein